MPTIVGILTFISMINTTSERHKARNFFICSYFNFYEQLKFRAQLSWACKKFYNPGARVYTICSSRFVQIFGGEYGIGIKLSLLFKLLYNLHTKTSENNFQNKKILTPSLASCVSTVYVLNFQIPDQGLPCLSRPFWQATSVRNFRTFTILVDYISPRILISMAYQKKSYLYAKSIVFMSKS